MGSGTIVPDSQPGVKSTTNNSSGLDNSIHKPQPVPETISLDNAHPDRVPLVRDADDPNKRQSTNEPPQPLR
jgi:hypothetical protein